MRFLQRVVYAAKGFSRSPLGHIANHAAKTTAGLYFDVFRRRYDAEGMTFSVPREQTTLSLRGKFVVDTYELPERILVKRHLRRDARVLELGGCIGVLSCVINRCLDNPSSHVVIEANPNLIPFLERNRDANQASFRVENCVVSQAATTNIAISRDMDSSTTGGKGLPVRTATLEELEAKYSLTFDAIVMDIEGGEASFIAENIDRLRRIEFLMVEFHPDILGERSVDQLRSALKAVGLEKVDDMLATEIYMRPRLV
jgi:FkbM family methyltransferase